MSTERSDQPSAAPAYTFGDGDVAARRLGLVARLFEPPTRALLARAAPSPPALALDLGCGPGFTTALVAEVTGAARTIGLDASADFLERATAANPGCEFEVADVTAPLPHAADAELVLCRLLLSHLPDPAAIVRGWAAQLTPGARLLLDEVEYIHPPRGALTTYEELVVDLVASRDAHMYAGPIIHAMADVGWRRIHDEVVDLAVPVRDAAAMFRLNLDVWRHDPHIVATRITNDIDALATALDDLAVSGTGHAGWGLRQMVLVVDHDAQP